MTLDATPKSIFTSVTFWGSVLAALTMAFPVVFQKLGITDANTAIVSQHIVQVVAFIITVWGRLRASQKVSLTGALPKPPTIQP